jgi:hypothetical protein
MKARRPIWPPGFFVLTAQPWFPVIVQGEGALLEARYKCDKCEHEFSVSPPEPMDCPICDSRYVTWLNYEETFGKDAAKRKS